MLRALILTILSFLSYYISGQETAIGSWKEHLSYRHATGLTEGAEKIYCLTEGGIFVFNKNDNSIETLSKTDGLSDTEPKAISYNPYNNKLVIAYKNGNIDIVSGNTITNVVDIKIKQTFGNKTINSIYFINEKAYLSCSFGIVVLNTDNYEINDTYIIGESGTLLNVNMLTSNNTYFFAATDSGIYKGNINNQNLASYTEWSRDTLLPVGVYNTINSFNNKIYTNRSLFKENGTISKDTVYEYSPPLWTYFGGGNATVQSITSNSSNLIITYDSLVSSFDALGTNVENISTYFGGYCIAKDALQDENNNYWIADTKFGLVSKKDAAVEYRYPNSPGSINVADMYWENNELWIAPGTNNGVDFADGVYSFIESEWKVVNGNFAGVVNMDTVFTINQILVNPANSDIVYASSKNGLVEFNKRIPTNLYNVKNSSLQYSFGGSSISINGLAIDKDGILWVANSGVANSISFKNTDNTWNSIDFSSFVGTTPNYTSLLVDNRNQLWVGVDNLGILVYNGNGESPSSINTMLLNSLDGNGELPNLKTTVLTKDLEGHIWIGSEEGLSVITNPGNIFSGGNFDAQEIFVEESGTTQLLLGTEIIQDIIIDAANKKWIATKNSGVFLMSENGTIQELHFDASETPLLSNDVKSIAINHTTGEIYFGTSQGVISFRGTAIAAFENFSNVLAFPNPVPHAYKGSIAVKGLMNNSIVKITDISGTLVFETQSNGGLATWNGKNLFGNRVSTGVYLVLVTNEDGSQKVATKILFIN